jgi:ABC-type glycerol-3-phosphate transport system permease component
MAIRAVAQTKAESRLNWRFRFRNAPYYTVLILWALITIFIFVWLVASSFKTNREVFGSPWALSATPLKAAAENYAKAWSLAHMGIYFSNSVIVTVASVVLVVAASAPAAYALSRVSFPGNSLVTYYFIAGMGLPYQLILVPLFVLLARLHIADTLQGLILTYVGVSIPFTILLLTGFFRTLPTELEDAAAIDGCGEFGIFWRVMLPLAGPGLSTAAIFNFVSMWNEFLLAMLIINNDKLRTMPLGIMNIRYSMQYTADWAALFAAVVIVIIPNFLIYLALSDRVMSGLTLGASK